MTQTSTKKHIWKLRKPEVQEKYKKAVEESINSSALLSHSDSVADAQSIWTEIKSCLINACDFVCGQTKGNFKQERETWWCEETVESLGKQKRTLWNEWQKGGSKENHLEAKGKQNQVYTLLKEKPRKKNSVSWKVVMAKNTFSNQLRE